MAEGFDTEKVIAINNAVRNWMKQKTSMLKSSIRAFGLVDKGVLVRTTNGTIGFGAGEAVRVSFKLKRYGIILNNGVSSLAKARPERPWFSNVINDNAVSDLAGVISKHTGDIMAREIADNMRLRNIKKG